MWVSHIEPSVIRYPLIFFSQPGMPKLSPPSRSWHRPPQGRHNAPHPRSVAPAAPAPRGAPCAETAEVGMVEAVQFIGNWLYQQSQLIVPQKEIHGYPRCIAAHKDLLFFPGTKNTNMFFMLYFTSLLSEIRLFGEEFPWLELGWEISH